jgi:hypothetical protein
MAFSGKIVIKGEYMETPMHLTCSKIEQERFVVLRIYPRDIEKVWAYVKYGLVDMRPLLASTDPDYVNSVLAGIISGRMQLWVGYTMEEENALFVGFIISYVDQAPSRSGVRFLYIYALYGFNGLAMEHIRKGQEALEGYARLTGCKSIRAEADIGTTDEWIQALGLGYKKAWTTLEKEL